MRLAGFVFPLLIASPALSQENPASPANEAKADAESEPETGEEDSENSEERGEPRIVPPSLTSESEIPYPEEARTAGAQGSVLLLLTIDDEGKVTSAEVLDGPGSGLNEAAKRGVLGFKFEPARVNGIPRAVKIKFVHEFKAPPMPPSEAPLPQPAETKNEKESAPRTEPVAPPTPKPPVSEVVVTGQREAQRLDRSANAVTVVELDRVKVQSSDLGEVLSRVQGVSFQRSAGLGSPGRFNMGGFDDGQVRAFVDGIPIELAGYPFGLANVPVNLAERVDIYNGVVPVRLGADALGGAFELITDHQTVGSAASFSYQAGSFDSHRLAASARHRDADTGLFGKIEGFFDTTDNDYRVDDVPVADNLGRVTRTSAYRFHDRYQAAGGNLEFGFVDRKWAQRLLIKAFVTDFRKDYQHGSTMEKAFGEANYGDLSAGGSIRFKEYLGAGVSTELIGGYTLNQTDWEDVSDCIYNWLGQCVFMPANPGEVSAGGSDLTLWGHTGYGRMHFSWIVQSEHILRATLAPTYFTRTGKERMTGGGALDRLGGERTLFQLVNGIEYETRQLDERLQNIAFVKQYYLNADSYQPMTEDWIEEAHTDGMFWGFGDGLRYLVKDWLITKASYEWATRLPRTTELFGNGANIEQNPKLEPERSHNVNLSTLVREFDTGFGPLDASVTGFFRQTDNMIVQLAAGDFFVNENVGETRTLGVEGAVKWVSPGEYVELAGNTTYQDVRNVSSDSEFSSFEGERVPNRPYLFANGRVRLQKKRLASPKDELSLTWYIRYVHEFLKSWTGFGTEDSQQTIDTQVTQDVVLAYVIRSTLPKELTFSGEIQNITDEAVFDFYKIQRPGRSVYFKTTMTF